MSIDITAKPVVVKDGVAHCPDCGGTDFYERQIKVYAMLSNQDGRMTFEEAGLFADDDPLVDRYWCEKCVKPVDLSAVGVDWEEVSAPGS